MHSGEGMGRELDMIQRLFVCVCVQEKQQDTVRYTAEEIEHNPRDTDDLTIHTYSLQSLDTKIPFDMFAHTYT